MPISEVVMNDIRLLWKESIARALSSMLPEGAETVTTQWKHRPIRIWVI